MAFKASKFRQGCPDIRLAAADLYIRPYIYSRCMHPAVQTYGARIHGGRTSIATGTHCCSARSRNLMH
eukprot:750280-Heterocapsa_arctica.AAC.1